MQHIISSLVAGILLLSLAACSNTGKQTWVSEEVIGTSVITGGTKETADDDMQTSETDYADASKNGGKTAKTTAGKTDKTVKTTVDKVKTTAKGTELTRTRRSTTTAGATTARTAAATYVTEDIVKLVADGRVQLIGRQEVAYDAVVMEYNNAAIKLYGELEGSIKMSVANTGSSLCRMHVVVDGDAANATTVDIDNNDYIVEVCKDLKKGMHTVEIIRGTCNDWKSLEIYNITYKGLLQTPPAALRMEFLGDSITCAMGAIMVDGTYNYGAKWQDGFYSYAATTARNLQADASVLSISGMTTAQVRAKFDDVKRDQNDGAWDFAANPQDIVVVNLGTNDLIQGVNSAAVTTAVNGMIADIRAAYGKDTYIIWAYGMMIDSNLSTYKNLVESYATKNSDNRVLFCDLSSAKNTGGWMDHPNREGQDAAAALLTAFIRKNCGDVL